MKDHKCVTYVTPHSPRQAVLNALCEIEAYEIRDHDEQSRIIIQHIRDFDGGQITKALLKKMTLTDIIKLLFDGGDE